MRLVSKVVNKVLSYLKCEDNECRLKSEEHLKRFISYSFTGNKCIDERQYCSVITRWYHTIEKGLAYVNFRKGFGQKNIEALITSMENYLSDGFSVDGFTYRTGLSVLEAYKEKNIKYGYHNEQLYSRIDCLPGISNNLGGIIEFTPPSVNELKEMNYSEFVKSRHSMRHFSNEPVDMEALKRAIELAQFTPSACNRQAWRTVVVCNKPLISNILGNQNGNEGFGHEFDKLLLVISDNRCFNRDRELFQVYIDGGMYVQSILYALHYEGIASVPLSAALRREQEKNIRELLRINDAEELILFIGIGNYPNKCQSTKSTRYDANIRYYT